jgi:AAA domain, putative AbiEii toxin, Type IV TA system
MIARVEALNYRCLKYVRQDLLPFHVLVGPNASGKSTFLDVFDFMSDVVYFGPWEAVSRRAPDVRDLVWMRSGDRFELAVDVVVPIDRRQRLKQHNYGGARYELAVGLTHETEQLAILSEAFWLTTGEASSESPVQRSLFPAPPSAPAAIVHAAGRPARRGWKRVVTKVAESGNDYFSSETSGWNNPFRLGPQKSALANLPEDETKFPVATWFKEFLRIGVQRLVLNSQRMQQPSAPGAPKVFLADGSNLPWVIDTLARRHRSRFAEWLAHVRTALPDLRTIRVIERPEDRHRYLILDYESGLKVPSWLVSDGILRLLVLTLLAYLPEANGLFLVEEPENGIHPRAVETVFQSLSSVYNAQVLLATHSPVVLGIAKPEQVLCFAKASGGETDIVRGSEHPRLRDWKGEVDLGTLFASGVLG